MGLGLVLKYCLCLLAGFLSFPATQGVALSEVLSPNAKIQIITPQWEGQTNSDGTGLFFEIIRRVYDPLNIKLVYRFASWKRCQAMVRSEQSDAMLCVWSTDAQRENQLIPRYPLYVEHTAVIYKRVSIPSWQGIHTLNLKRAVWLRGHDYHTYAPLRNIRFSNWHEVDTHKKAWHQLNLDRFDVYLDALIDLNDYIKNNSIDMNLYQKEVLWSQESYVAFSNTPRSRKLIQTFDQQIQQLFRSGQLEKIYQKWGQPFYPKYWEGN